MILGSGLFFGHPVDSHVVSTLAIHNRVDCTNTLKLSAQLNETETKQFLNSFETVLKLLFQPKQNALVVTVFQFHFVVRTVSVVEKRGNDWSLCLYVYSGGSKNFERGEGSGRQFISSVLIYRKCAQRNICLLHGKSGFFGEKMSQ